MDIPHRADVGGLVFAEQGREPAHLRHGGAPQAEAGGDAREIAAAVHGFAGIDAVGAELVDQAELGRIEKLKASLRPDGALWVIRPKGRPGISELAVMRAGQAAGLVDVKVVSFSATHTAEKFVIPLRARP